MSSSDLPSNVIPLFPDVDLEHGRDLPAQPESPEAPLPPPDLRYRDLEGHRTLARMFGYDPRYSLEAQGMETIPLAPPLSSGESDS